MAGQEAVRLALAGRAARWWPSTAPRGSISPRSIPCPLQEVANAQRTLPDAYINAESNGVTPAFRDYARPLLGGPSYPMYGCMIASHERG